MIMKNLFKYTLVLLAAAGMMASCAKEVEDVYTKGEADVANCMSVSFPKQDEAGSHTLEPTAPKTVTFKAKRAVTTGDVTIPVEVVDTAGVFNVGAITFADGQEETTFDVTFPNVKVGVKYGLSINITDPKYASIYGAGSVSLKYDVMVVTWEYILNPQTNEPALFTFDQAFWGETAWAYIKYYEVDGVRTCFTETILHEYNGEEYDDPGFWGYGEEYEWKFIWYPNVAHPSIEGATLIEFPAQPTGYVRDDLGMIYVGDEISERNFIGQGPYSWMNNALKENFLVSYYDGKGGIYLAVWWYFNAEGRGWNQSAFDTIGIGEGFIRTDYEVKEVEADYPTEGYTPIYVETGKDVSYVKYAVYPGELSSKQAENKAPLIADGTDESVKFDEFDYDEEALVQYATLEVVPEATGEYTFVVVSFNEKDEPQSVGYTVFNHVAAEDIEDYEVTVSVFTEDTPARYTTLNKWDSFAIGVSGEDLTEVHVGIFDEATIAKYGSQVVMDAVKADDSGNYALSEDKVAEVNALGGYYDVASGLKGSTKYYVIVWATNGAMDDFAIASYTTAKLPYIWNEIGKGTLTDGFFVSMFSRPDYTVPCTLYAEANTPGLYMMTDYQLPLVAAFFGLDEETMAQYEGGNWNKTQLIIDATDPTAVVIPEQDYGVCVNSSYGFVLIDTEATGTLIDGVITFPARNMYVGLAGSWYYGNAAATFAIRFPEAVAEVPAATPAVEKANASVENVELTSAYKANRPKMVYEREAQPVKVAVKVSHERKSKDKGFNKPVTIVK